MVCHLFGAKLLLKPMLAYYQFNTCDPIPIIWDHDRANYNEDNKCEITFCKSVFICLGVHYLNQFWLDISDHFWHSTERNITATGQANILYNKFENYTLEVTDTSPRGEYVKTKESTPRQHNGTQGSLCLAPANQLAANKQPLWYSIPSTLGVLCFKRWSYCLHVLFRGYPAKRALSAMREHGG